MEVTQITQNAAIISAWASVLTVIISAATLFSTFYFSYRQRQHNINSVRPIAAVKLNRKNGFIIMSIQNVGTGPLTIKELHFIHLNDKHDTLKWILDEVDASKVDVERVIERSTKDWTIAVGTQLTMLSIKANDIDTDNKITNLLFSTSIELTYSDIYNKQYSIKPHFLDIRGRLDE